MSGSRSVWPIMESNKMNKNLTTFIILISLFLTACANTMQGQMYSPKTKKTEIVNFSFTTPIWDSGEITATTKDGEIFTGKYVNKKSDFMGMGLGFNGNAGMFAGQSHTGDMMGTLVGNKGNSMQCLFTPNHTGPNIWKSGVGKCDVSDGRKIDVIF